MRYQGEVNQKIQNMWWPIHPVQSLCHCWDDVTDDVAVQSYQNKTYFGVKQLGSYRGTASVQDAMQGPIFWPMGSRWYVPMALYMSRPS